MPSFPFVVRSEWLSSPEENPPELYFCCNKLNVWANTADQAREACLVTRNIMAKYFEQVHKDVVSQLTGTCLYLITIRVCGWIIISVMSVCLCVCLSACVSVFVSVQAITFEPLKPGTLFTRIHLYNIYAKFEYQGHWIKVNIKWMKSLVFHIIISHACISKNVAQRLRSS